MSCATALLSLLLFSPCEEERGPERAYPNDAPGAGAASVAVARSTRPETDRERDALRRPAEVLSFVGIEPGMTVFELFSGGGYYTELLSGLVGDNGHVIAHNNAAYVRYTEDALSKRQQDGRLENVEVQVAEVDDLELAPNSLDAALLVLAWHDLYFADASFDWPDPDEQALLGKLCAALRPDGVVGVIDHVAAPGGDTSEVAQRLHRIDPETVRAAFESSCFTLAASSDVLANPDDDHSLPMSDPAVRGRTDRFVHRYEKK